MGLHMVSRIASPIQDDWVKWIYNDDGGANFQSIDGDADGAFTQRNTILVDLPHALSRTLGRQMSSMSTYDVEYIRVELVNFDDSNDNESGLSVSGHIYHWTPSKHRVDAMQMARKLETAYESTQVDEDSFLISTEKDYKGIRFNWDADNQVHVPTQEGFFGLQGAQWDLAELFDVYGDMQDNPLIYQNALWNNRCGNLNSQGFECSYLNYTSLAAENHFMPTSHAFESNHPISVLGGLLAIDFTHSSVDSSLNINDDDYLVQVTVGVRGWSDF